MKVTQVTAPLKNLDFESWQEMSGGVDTAAFYLQGLRVKSWTLQVTHESDLGHILSTAFCELFPTTAQAKVTQDQAGIAGAVCLLSQGVLPAPAQPLWLQELVQLVQPVQVMLLPCYPGLSYTHPCSGKNMVLCSFSERSESVMSSLTPQERSERKNNAHEDCNV